MGASQLAQTCKIHCFSNTSVDLSCRRFDRVAPVFFRTKIVRSGNVSFLCLHFASPAITVHTQSVSGCWTCLIGRVLLSSQGSHSTSRELKPCVPVEAFLSWGHLDVDGFLEQQLPGVPGHVSDPLPIEKKAKVVYQIPCSCGKSYIGKTRRRLETNLRKHQEACQKETMERSAVAEHAWKDHHAIKWV